MKEDVDLFFRYASIVEYYNNAMVAFLTKDYKNYTINFPQVSMFDSNFQDKLRRKDVKAEITLTKNCKETANLLIFV